QLVRDLHLAHHGPPSGPSGGIAPTAATPRSSRPRRTNQSDTQKSAHYLGIVLVTPALLRRLQGEGIADKELSALLARDLLVPVVHDTTYDALREVSPLLGSRSGLSTEENTLADVAGKLAELVAI